MALMALVTTMAIPSITSYFRLSLQTASRELASTVRETYNSTMVTGKVHRLVYDFKERQYWVESGPATVLLDTAESKEREERRRRSSTKLDEEAPKSPFALEKTITRKKVDLPSGVEFEDVLTEQSPEPLTEGLAYTHFFPHGLTERTVIHLKDDSKHNATLVIAPLTGRTDLYDRAVSAKEALGDG